MAPKVTQRKSTRIPLAPKQRTAIRQALGVDIPAVHVARKSGTKVAIWYDEATAVPLSAKQQAALRKQFGIDIRELKVKRDPKKPERVAIWYQ